MCTSIKYYHNCKKEKHTLKVQNYAIFMQITLIWEPITNNINAMYFLPGELWTPAIRMFIRTCFENHYNEYFTNPNLQLHSITMEEKNTNTAEVIFWIEVHEPANLPRLACSIDEYVDPNQGRPKHGTSSKIHVPFPEELRFI